PRLAFLFIGAQDDFYDTPKDMAMSLFGVLIAVMAIMVSNKIFRRNTSEKKFKGVNCCHLNRMFNSPGMTEKFKMKKGKIFYYTAFFVFRNRLLLVHSEPFGQGMSTRGFKQALSKPNVILLDVRTPEEYTAEHT